MGKLKERMLELIDRLDELEQAKEKVEDVLYYIEDADHITHRWSGKKRSHKSKQRLKRFGGR